MTSLWITHAVTGFSSLQCMCQTQFDTFTCCIMCCLLHTHTHTHTHSHTHTYTHTHTHTLTHSHLYYQWHNTFMVSGWPRPVTCYHVCLYTHKALNGEHVLCSSTGASSSLFMSVCNRGNAVLVVLVQLFAVVQLDAMQLYTFLPITVIDNCN